jgi:hypothetical protein
MSDACFQRDAALASFRDTPARCSAVVPCALGDDQGHHDFSVERDGAHHQHVLEPAVLLPADGGKRQRRHLMVD